MVDPRLAAAESQIISLDFYFCLQLSCSFLSAVGLERGEGFSQDGLIHWPRLNHGPHLIQKGRLRHPSFTSRGLWPLQPLVGRTLWSVALLLVFFFCTYALQPLSAAYLSDEHYVNEKSATDDLELGQLPDNQTTTNQPGSNFPNFTQAFLPTLRKPPSNPKATARPVNAIRVVILVAMPSPRDPGTGARHVTTATASSSETNLLKKAPEEFQIGVETLPWRES